jgi:hypothetical protein
MATKYSPKVVNDGLVLYLDAANTKSYPGSGATWYDLSGNDNNGELIANPEYNTANNGNIILNGSTQYVTCGNSSSLNLTSSGSLSIWCKINNWSGSADYWSISGKGLLLDLILMDIQFGFIQDKEHFAIYQIDYQ